MSIEKASNSPIMCPVKGQKPSFGTQSPKINSRACLWVSPRPRHHIQSWLTNQRLILLRISSLETPKTGAGPKNFRTEPSPASSSAISLPRTPAKPGSKKHQVFTKVSVEPPPLLQQVKRGGCKYIG